MWISCYWESLTWAVWPLGRRFKESLYASDGADGGLGEMTTRVPSSSELWHSRTDEIAFPLFYVREKMDLLILS